MMFEGKEYALYLGFLSLMFIGYGVSELFDAYIKMTVELAKIQAGCKP